MDFIKRNSYIIYVIITTGLSFTCLGGSLSWSSPAMVKLTSPTSPIPLDAHQVSWAGSLLAIGAVFVAVPYTWLFNRAGRKWLVVAIGAFYIGGWTALIFATEVWHIYVGRLLFGAAVGPTYGLIPVYLAEVVGKSVRGMCVAVLVVSQSAGALFQYVLGPMLSFQEHNIVSIGFPVVFFGLSLMLPESPYYLIGVSEDDRAENVLMKLRGSKERKLVRDEFEDIKKCLQESPPMTYNELLGELTLDKTKKVIVIILIGTFAQQFSGIGAVMVYMELIFKKMNSTIAPKNAVIIAEILADFTILTMIYFIDRIGRKKLLAMSALICIIGHTMLAAYFKFEFENSLVGMMGVFLLQIGFGMGLGSVPVMVMSEVMSFSLKGWLSGFYLFVQGIYNASTIKLFQIINDNLGEHYSYMMFAISIFTSVVFLVFYMPETRNRSLQEIQHLLTKKTENGVQYDVVEQNSKRGETTEV